MRYEVISARTGEEANVIGKEVAEKAGGEFLTTFSMAFNGGARRDFRRAMRYHNPDRLVSFDLKHRHKGRPIKGIRNCPRPKKLTLTISNLDID
jgi:hypothetical protein